jgi:hypothetical protein
MMMGPLTRDSEVAGSTQMVMQRKRSRRISGFALQTMPASEMPLALSVRRNSSQPGRNRSRTGFGRMPSILATEFTMPVAMLM